MLTFNKKRKADTYDKGTLVGTLATIIGQISDDEIFILYNYALAIKTGGIIVEIGSFRGKSSIALGLGAKKNNVKVYCIDPHEEFVGVRGGKFGPVDLKDKIKHIHEFGLGEILFPVCLSSLDVAEIWHTPIDLLWIDGNHTYEYVSKDFNGFAKHVIPGGVIILHDRLLDGVAKLITEIDMNFFENIGTVDNMAIFRKR
jgi:predicted O-methyltransferase YrrM